MTEKPRGQEQMKALNQVWPEQGVEEVSGVLGGGQADCGKEQRQLSASQRK